MGFKVQGESLPVPAGFPDDPKFAAMIQSMTDEVIRGLCGSALKMIEVGGLLYEKHQELEISNGEVAAYNKNRNRKTQPKKDRVNWEDWLSRHFSHARMTAHNWMRVSRQWDLLLELAETDNEAALLVARVRAGKAPPDWMKQLPALPKQLKTDPEDFLERLDKVTEALAGTTLDGEHRLKQRRELAALQNLNELGEEDAIREWENRLNKVEWLLKDEEEGGEGFTLDNLPAIDAALKIPKKLRKRIRPLKAGSSGSELKALADCKDPPPAKPGKKQREPEPLEPIVRELEKGAVSVKDARAILRGGGGDRALQCHEYARAYVDGAKVRIDLAVSKALEFRRVVEELNDWCKEIAENPSQPGGVCGSLYNETANHIEALDDFVNGVKKMIPWEFCGTCDGSGRDGDSACANCGGTGWLNFGMAQAAAEVGQ